MTVIYFGSYNYHYPRNRTLIDGLRAQGVEVVEVHDRSRLPLKYFRLFRKHWPYRHRYDFMIIGFPGFTVVPLAKLIATAPVVFDAFISTYDANVLDRQVCRPGSLRAKYYYFLDWLSVRLADLVLLDTYEYINYFVKTYKVPQAKFRRIFIGAHDKIYFPSKNKPLSRDAKFTVVFWGWMIPNHGVEFILEAAQILQDQEIHFLIIGGGPEKPKILKLKEKLGLKNVEITGPFEASKLVPYIQAAQVALGIFGRTDKIRRVIPNKVYEALACRKSVLTADTEAVREVLNPGVNCLVCRSVDAQDLAEKILLLKNNEALRENIAQAGYELYLEKFTPKALGAALKEVLEWLT